MTIQTHWIFNGNKQSQETDPLIVKWIDKLHLENENIVISHETKEGYARFTLQYNHNIDTWVITLPIGFDINLTLHKLGYIWVWKNTGVLSKIKENWYKRTNIYCLADSCILDNIVFYKFCEMDKEFKDFWFDYVIKDLAYFYKGSCWYMDLPNMVYQYIVNYLTWNYVLGQEVKNKYSNYIMYNLIKRKDEILEKAQITLVNYTKKDFRRLHKLLRLFAQIIEVKGYLAIQTYINQIFFYFPLTSNNEIENKITLEFQNLTKSMKEIPDEIRQLIERKGL